MNSSVGCRDKLLLCRSCRGRKRPRSGRSCRDRLARPRMRAHRPAPCRSRARKGTRGADTGRRHMRLPGGSSRRTLRSCCCRSRDPRSLRRRHRPFHPSGSGWAGRSLRGRANPRGRRCRRCRSLHRPPPGPHSLRRIEPGRRRHSDRRTHRPGRFPWRRIPRRPTSRKASWPVAVLR
jgi:hypothetical protein